MDLWKSAHVSLCLSKPIIDEYVAVLQRLGSQNERELSELLGLFAPGHHIDFCARKPQLHVVEEGADDNKFIECAVALKADYVISGDKSILRIREYMDIRIVSPLKTSLILAWVTIPNESLELLIPPEI